MNAEVVTPGEKTLCPACVEKPHRGRNGRRYTRAELRAHFRQAHLELNMTIARARWPTIFTSSTKPTEATA